MSATNGNNHFEGESNDDEHQHVRRNGALDSGWWSHALGVLEQQAAAREVHLVRPEDWVRPAFLLEQQRHISCKRGEELDRRADGAGHGR